MAYGTIVGQQPNLSNYLPLSGGTITGNLSVNGTTTLNNNLNMGNNVITNVGNPVAGTDALNKDYVDSLFSFTMPDSSDYSFIGNKTIQVSSIIEKTDYVSVPHINGANYITGFFSTIVWGSYIQFGFFYGEIPNTLNFSTPHIDGGHIEPSGAVFEIMGSTLQYNSLYSEIYVGTSNTRLGYLNISYYNKNN